VCPPAPLHARTGRALQRMQARFSMDVRECAMSHASGQQACCLTSVDVPGQRSARGVGAGHNVHEVGSAHAQQVPVATGSLRSRAESRATCPGRARQHAAPQKIS